ncbi:TPA_asm: ATP-binding protein, partial [Listeria monocytogenes]|nr:ATP-binding protein [Listeria monocytogenes]HBI6233775.1 ATP-binding protein [Listeria monocytogenes]HDI3563128.1 ATP-binding protein [Listeria monocytogenes]
NENIEDNSVSIQLILKYNEIAKIKNIVKLAEDMETKKAKVVESVNLFCETINSFISTDGTEKKEILIDENGGIYLQNVIEKKQLSIYKLSSGEKQIVIFYANLIFGVNENKRGIFIVDEPELSLHLSWQKLFIEKTIELNKNIQFIFATHSPEIIGKYYNKTFELKK